VGAFSPDYLAEPLTPYPLPTKDGGVLRTIGDARAYMLGLSEVRQWLDHWKPAYRLFVHGAGAAPLTLQAYAGLSKDGQLDVEAFEHIAPSAMPPDATAGRWLYVAAVLGFLRRHQPRRPPLASSTPGRPAPTMGPGTSCPRISPPAKFTVWILK
jgi:hypothetical protein